MDDKYFDEFQAKEKWNRDQALRDEFQNDFESYMAYSEAESLGRIKRLKDKR